jgi:hypothetical protein
VAYEAELLTPSGSVLAGYRIFSHDDRELLVEPGTGLIPSGATQVQVKAKFFKVVTNGSEGLGPTYAAVSGPNAGVPVPIANVRIGFALHLDPDAANIEDGRFPEDQQQFLHSFDDTELATWLANNATMGIPPPRYIQWDIIFDMAFKPGAAEPPALSPSTPRPSLQFLRVPFRF